ncbi:MAG: PAS domain-containing protein, partial [Limisphaerales bacterium]
MAAYGEASFADKMAEENCNFSNFGCPACSLSAWARSAGQWSGPCVRPFSIRSWDFPVTQETQLARNRALATEFRILAQAKIVGILERTEGPDSLGSTAQASEGDGAECRKSMQLKFDWLIVLENLRRGIMVTDTTLEGPAGPRIIYVNSAWLKMTGYGRDELSG